MSDARKALPIQYFQFLYAPSLIQHVSSPTCVLTKRLHVGQRLRISQVNDHRLHPVIRAQVGGTEQGLVVQVGGHLDVVVVIVRGYTILNWSESKKRMEGSIRTGRL